MVSGLRMPATVSHELSDVTAPGVTRELLTGSSERPVPQPVTHTIESSCFGTRGEIAAMMGPRPSTYPNRQVKT